MSRFEDTSPARSTGGHSPICGEGCDFDGRKLPEKIEKAARRSGSRIERAEFLVGLLGNIGVWIVFLELFVYGGRLFRVGQTQNSRKLKQNRRLRNEDGVRCRKRLQRLDRLVVLASALRDQRFLKLR